MLVVLATAADERGLELRGQIEPAPGRAAVTLHGSDSPYSASTLSGPKGRFRFKNLLPGAYTVIIFVPGLGEVRRTVEVSPGLADPKGRVAVTIPFAESGESAIQSLEERGTVSVRQLSIPKRARNEYGKARKKLNKRDVAGAIQHLERAVELAPGFVAAWNNLGTIAYQSAEYERAEKYFREALSHEPGSYSPVVNLGGTLLSLHRYDEALKYNQYALAERPDDALANSQMGMNHFYLGDEEKAIKYLRAAKRIDPAHFSHPQLILAEIYRRRGDRVSLIEELEDFLARHPDSGNSDYARRTLEQLKQAPGR